MRTCAVREPALDNGCGITGINCDCFTKLPRLKGKERKKGAPRKQPRLSPLAPRAHQHIAPAGREDDRKTAVRA